ncbi:MFS transporter [Catenuloplanes atrovinosus]|uniref:MFS family permease n=1 Tax=Catenuloplanes atrovinosus TaxID=137266 RepID=A0AAE3YLZ3_9ACTN|nr:MFS transporter [Catenuloplanes atrovinosus]MDR7274771.1 MFS family permease [Catenuloplanes atrovinosus]
MTITPAGAWLAGTAVSLLGTQAMAFALLWASAEGGAPLAALTLTAVTLPRALLLLPAGALADRLGPWRVLVGADAAAATATLVFALLLAAFPGALWLIPPAALATGLVDAVYLPASATVPRLLAANGLARVMAGRQIAAQAAALAGPALGGAAVTVAGPAPVMAANAVTFAAMALLLARLRRFLVPASPAAAGPAARSMLDGVRVLAADPVLRPALLLTTAAAGFLLPVSGLLLPLLARDRSWTAAQTGLLAGALATGTGAVAIAVLTRGAWRRAGLVIPAGLLLAAAGVVALAVVRPPLPAALAALLIGAGSGLFATHLGPLFLARAPGTHLARTQAVVVLAQTLPLLATNNALGALAAPLGVPALLLGCAAVLATAAIAGLGTRALRAM